MTVAPRQVGFTGTKNGMTAEQRRVVRTLLVYREFIAHHGACVGADADFDRIVRTCTGLFFVTLYPSNIPTMRAITDTKPHDVVHPVEPPLDRNKKIVSACDVLIATPKEPNMVLRSGTWSTVRYARKLGKPIIVVHPNGMHLVEGVSGLCGL